MLINGIGEKDYIADRSIQRKPREGSRELRI